MRTLTKKRNRLTHQITSALGLFQSCVQDNGFEQEKSKFDVIQSTLKHFHQDVNDFLKSLRELLDIEKDLFTDALFLADSSDDYQRWAKLEENSNRVRSLHFQSYVSLVVQNCLSPCALLLRLFSGPMKLCDKRQDKLMDF
jgi:hypothetical protein